MKEFFAMGGYAAYVWGAFGLTFVVFIWNITAARAFHTRALITAKRRLAIEKEIKE